MKSTRFMLLISLSTILFFASCNEGVDKSYGFKLKNNSDKQIMYWVSYNYPDTSLSVEKEISGGIASGDFHFIDSRTPWPERIDEIPGDTLLIFIFDPDTLESYPWSQIRNDYKILKRIELGQYDTPPLDHAVNYP